MATVKSKTVQNERGAEIDDQHAEAENCQTHHKTQDGRSTPAIHAALQFVKLFGESQIGGDHLG